MTPTTLFSSIHRLRTAIHSIALSGGSILALSACATAPNAPETATASERPKNIILFVGDGMGVSTVTAARIFDGQQKGGDGESHSLSFETFPEAGLVKTYNSNAQVPDSAGTATAMFSGYKTNRGVINVRPADDIMTMALGSCDGGDPILLRTAKDAGKAVGVISTARLTHATPAAVYGRVIDRGFESDADMPDILSQRGCTSLADQLVRSDLDLALGGGAGEFTEEQIAVWPGTVVGTAAEMNAADTAPLLGLFNRSHMSYEADRAGTEEPSLSDMTSEAIDRLSSDADGYVLMVEAGRVDHAHHGTNAYQAMRDMQALNEAVETAIAKAGRDTMIVVTADHSHVFVVQGYPVRGNPILGLVRESDYDRETNSTSVELALDNNGKPYTTVGYYNGPNVRLEDSPTLDEETVLDPDYQQQTAIGRDSETHAGEDVPLYATGPGSDRFGGVMEQSEIGQIVADLLKD